jgi:type III pantothenate kinase
VNFKAVLADNTQDAIISGCINAQIGAVMRALEHLHQPEARCIFSGGAAQYIAPFMPHPCQQIENLVLIGLAVSHLSEPA